MTRANLCPYCHTAANRDDHTRLCKLKLSRDELYNLRVTRRLPLWEIAQIATKKCGVRISRKVIARWIKLYNIPSLKLFGGGGAKVPVATNEIKNCLLLHAGSEITVKQIQEECNVGSSTILAVLHDMLADGQVTRLNHVRWRLAARSDGQMSRAEQRRYDAGWPSLGRGGVWQKR